MKRWKTLLVAASVVAVAERADAQAFDRLINFGDSLSDAGNVRSITGGIYPGQSYFNGRLSNGPVWAEGLGVRLGLPAVTASRSGGLNYATGGSRTGSGSVNVFLFFNLPNAGTQIESFLGAKTPAANDLATLWSGANDFLDGQTNPAIPAANMRAHVDRLINAGERDLLVINLPAIGETPRYRNSPERATMNARSAQYNAALATHLDAVAAARPDATIYRVDIAGLFADAIAAPSAYGLSNVTEAALRSDGTVAANVDEYLFYDDVHPTRVGHALFAETAFETVTTRTVRPTVTAAIPQWSVAETWAQRRVPDPTSSVTIGTVGSLSLNAPVLVRRLAINSGSQLDLSAAASIRVSGDLTLAGRVRLALDGDGASIIVGETATFAGSIALRFVEGFIGLPGTQLPLMTFGDAVGLPQLVNQSGFAGLSMLPVISADTLSVRFDARSGDANLDASINFADLVLLAQNYNQLAGQNWLDGDFNGDGGVAFADLVLLAQNYNAPPATFASDWARAQSLVPEPVGLLAGSSIVLALRRRRVCR